MSQGLVSLLERGHLDRLSLASIRRIAHALDADLSLQVRWRGGDLDRLVDEGHATLVGVIVNTLKRAGWTIRIEASYSIYGERGSIDVLAWHPETRTLLVVEVKTELTNVEETLRKHDEKARLGRTIAEQHGGWQPARIARLLVLPDSATARRRVDRHGVALGLAYPRRGADARRWLRAPDSPASMLLFVKAPTSNARAVSRKRIRKANLAA